MSGLNTPFRRLEHQLKSLQSAVPEASVTPRAVETQPAPSDTSESDADLFLREMEDVTRLKHDPRVSNSPTGVPRRGLRAGDNEAIAELNDLVAGRNDFDVTDTDEYVEGCVVGLDTRLVRKLRTGAFARQAAVDLHGMKADEAAREVEAFVSRAVGEGLRCVLVVHGRGRNSPGRAPVLKDRLTQWLTRGRLAKSILAFCTARGHDGGPGATYVLLRRKRGRRHPVRVFEGAKHE